MRGRRGVFPGSFNPPTTAHLSIATAARSQHELELVELVLSRTALGKPDPVGPNVEQRARVLRQLARRLRWLSVRVTDAQLLAEIAEGADVLILGADKWHQIHDPCFYGGSAAERDAAIARLPTVAIAPRDGLDVPEAARLQVGEDLEGVSSTVARAGRSEVMLPEAIAAGLWGS